MVDPAVAPILEQQIPCNEALRIADADARTAYRDLTPFRITVELQDDGWHVDCELRKTGMKGGGPHYVIGADSGHIVSKRYEQQRGDSHPHQGNPMGRGFMANPDIEQVIHLYWEGDRSNVRARYDDIFASVFAHVRDVDQSEDYTDEVEEEEGQAEEHSAHIATAAGDDDLSTFLEVYMIQPVLGELLEVQWQAMDDASKGIASHYLWGLACQSRWTPEHLHEGVFTMFGPTAGSHLIHAVTPEAGLPVGEDVTNVSFRRLASILEMYGIEFELDSDYSVEKWWSISNAVSEFAGRQQLEPWQLWATIYDLGPRLLPKDPLYPTERLRVWFVATNKDFAQFEEIDRHEAENVGTWAINPDVRRGDIALMYCTAPRSAITAVYRCATDAHYDPFGGWNDYRGEITECIHIPWITLSEMKKDAVLKEWKLVRSNMQGTLRHEIPENMWQRILELVAERDANVGERLQQYSHAARGVRQIKVSGERRSEIEFEEQVVIPLLEKLGWKLEKTLRRQVEMSIKIGSGRPSRVFADFVGYPDSLTTEGLLVIEVKRRIANTRELQQAVEQAESYAGKVRADRFAIASPEGFWIYELQFPGQSNQLLSLEVEEDLSEHHVQQIGEHMAFERLKTRRRQMSH